MGIGLRDSGGLGKYRLPFGASRGLSLREDNVRHFLAQRIVRGGHKDYGISTATRQEGENRTGRT
jgi:hypothetical protein